MELIVVIPSSRAVHLEYLSPLIESRARFIVVDDTEGTIVIDHPQFRVCNWGDRRRMLGKLDPVLPRRNGACRDIGFYIAWHESTDDDIVIALDDDCVVEHDDFATRVARALEGEGARHVAVSGRHLNILELYEQVGDPPPFPRGFPYSQRLGHRKASLDGAASGMVAFNLGLWTGVFDVNAIDKIKGPAYCHGSATLVHEQVIVPRGVLVSACSMNMHFRRNLIPAVFQLPMYVEVMPGWVVDRYGDIWGGFILKSLMDIRGDRMAVGGPMIRHDKEGSYDRNIWQEHLCHLLNDEFIGMVDAICADIPAGTYLEMMQAFTDRIPRHGEDATPLLGAYLSHLEPSLSAWLAALKSRPA